MSKLVSLKLIYTKLYFFKTKLIKMAIKCTITLLHCTWNECNYSNRYPLIFPLIGKVIYQRDSLLDR